MDTDIEFETEDSGCWCHLPPEDDTHDCLDYMGCDECPYYNNYEED